MGVNVFSTKYLFYVSYWRRDGHFARSSKPHQGLVVYREKTVPSFLRYFKTLSLGQAPGIKHTASRSVVKRSRLVTELIMSRFK